MHEIKEYATILDVCYAKNQKGRRANCAKQGGNNSNMIAMVMVAAEAKVTGNSCGRGGGRGGRKIGRQDISFPEW